VTDLRTAPSEVADPVEQIGADPVLRATRSLRPPLPAGAAFVVGVGLLGLLLLATLLAPLLVPTDPLLQDLTKIALAPGADPAHPLGTDQVGRDMLSRLLHGGRLPMTIGALSVLVGGALGSLLGVVAGYAGGVVDTVLSRLADAQLALPTILVAITLLTFAGRSTSNLVVVIALGGWPTFFRVCRSQVLSTRERAFVAAAVAMGASRTRIVLTHLLPAVRGLVVVTATLDFSRALLVASGLTYLGLGVQPPHPDWGLMVAEGQTYLASAWWIATLPGVGIILAVFATNLIGDALIDRARR